MDGNTVTTGYQLEKRGGTGTGGNYRFCFSATSYPQKDVDFSKSEPIKSKAHVVLLGVEYGKPILRVVIHRSLYCGHASEANTGSNADGQSPMKGITFKTRSLEEIFSFLGEIVRTELGIAGGAEASLAIPSSDRPPFHFFHVERRPPVGEEPWVTLNGQMFSIRIDPSGYEDASSRILQLMTDLLALQSSAKNLPAPNLIAITTP